MHVYTDKAVYVGDVDDVVINVDGKKIESLAVSKLNPELIELKNFKGIKIPYRIILAVGDVVIIRHLVGSLEKRED